jgi:ketosteroid isomerase-like protein
MGALHYREKRAMRITTSAQEAPDVRDARAGVLEAAMTWLRAAEAGDIDGYLAAITEDAVMMYAGQPAVIGKEDVRRFLDQFFPHFSFRFEPWESHEIVVAGNWAFHRYSGIAAITPKTGGEPEVLDRKYIDILRLEGGVWKTSHHIFNTNR